MDKKPIQNEKKNDDKVILRRRQGSEEVAKLPSEEPIEFIPEPEQEIIETGPGSQTKQKTTRRRLNKRARKVHPASLSEEVQKKIEEGENPDIALAKPSSAKEPSMANKKSQSSKSKSSKNTSSKSKGQGKRGRPPKAAKAASIPSFESPEKLSENPEALLALIRNTDQGTNIGPRRRGRPRKTAPSVKALLAEPSAPRKAGRPRKNPVETESTDADALLAASIAPKKRGRKPKAENTVATSQKRGPGRPRKAENTEAEAATTQKRGPGRPRKAENAEAAPKKRGPGRPRKAENTEAAPKKRGPGRPRKAENAEAAPKKRGPGRPRKNESTAVATTPKRGPGRPRKSESTAVATTPKRGPGRPRKAEVMQVQREQVLQGVGPDEAITFRALQTQLQALQTWRGKEESLRLRVRKALEGSAKRTNDDDYREVVESLIFKLLFPEEPNNA
ncbi:MAG: hypothetical protein H6727_11040 [Myxococcales bacterium]|nr:hypothetical protein [Myxococcales bacterium]